jgi:tRNA1(Val) A37 N6-methylase TrmN6
MELETRLRDTGFQAKRIRYVHPRRASEAYIVLVEADLHGGEEGEGGAGPEISPPLVIYDENDEYTSEVGKLFAKISPQCY